MARVLIAEDDPDVRDVVAFRLEQAGHEVVPVADGVAALAEVRRRVPELVVLDVAMPGMSGLDVCRVLRSDPATAALPIMILTARGREDDVAGGFRAGADDYLVKPFSARELAARVRALLDRA